MRAERVKPAPAKDRNGKSEKWHVKSDRPGFRGLWLVCFGDGRATKRRRNRRRRPLSPGSEGLAADKAVPSGPADRAGGSQPEGFAREYVALTGNYAPQQAAARQSEPSVPADPVGGLRRVPATGPGGSFIPQGPELQMYQYERRWLG